MNEEDKILITYEELNDPAVDEVLAQTSAFRRGLRSEQGGADTEKESFIHKSWFYLMLAGLFGTLIAWAIIEPHFEDESLENGIGYLLFPMVGGLAGLFIGGAEGFLARNYPRAIKGSAVGFGIGFGGGLISSYVAGILFVIIELIGWSVVGEEAMCDPGHSLPGFLLLVIQRSLAWAVAGMTVGLGPGIALKSKKLTFNGFLGGMIGGLIGGFLFDPINFIVSGGTMAMRAEPSRAIGFAVIGASAGLMIGLVEMMTKDAWLLMTAGPLAGKQFIVYKNPTRIGRSPKCEIFLFKDPSTETQHAAIHKTRVGYEIEDLNTRGGTWVNNQNIHRKPLVDGDTIQIGEARFIYSEREKKPSS